jgi:hypothetical protein
MVATLAGTCRSVMEWRGRDKGEQFLRGLLMEEAIKYAQGAYISAKL